jgi:ABC-type phosphate/phosphonate transport system substrate-binding protein
MSPKKRIQALRAGKIDIAMASHGLQIEQLTNQRMVVEKVAKMAVVFGINAGLPITNLTE